MKQLNEKIVDKLVNMCNEVNNPLRKENEKLFQNEVLQGLDDDTKNKLLHIRSEVEKQFHGKKYISGTSILFNKNFDTKGEFIWIMRLLDKAFVNSMYYDNHIFLNCEGCADELSRIFTKNQIANCKFFPTADHTFNLFEINGQVFFYDQWHGGLIGKFEPEFFYKHCNIYSIKPDYISEFECSTEVNQLTIKNAFDKIKNFKENKKEEYISIVKPRLEEYIKSKNGFISDVSDILNQNTIEKKFGVSIDQSIELKYTGMSCIDEIKKIMNKRINLRKNNSTSQIELTDIKESFENLYSLV